MRWLALPSTVLPLLALLAAQLSTVRPTVPLTATCSQPQWPQRVAPLPAPSCGGCDYGAQPGWWHPGRDLRPGQRWRILSQGCQLRNLLIINASHPETTSQQHAAQQQGSTLVTSPEDPVAPACPSEGQSAQPRIVLLIGDSIDRQLLEAMSLFSEVQMVKCGRVRFLPTACGDAAFATVHLHGR